MVFPRLSTRHLFAEAIWKFNACALTRKITPPFRHPPGVLVRNYLSRFPTSPRIHMRTNTCTLFTHPSVFRRRKTLTGHYLAHLSLADLVTPRCRYMDTSVSYVTGYVEFYYEGISAKFVCICNAWLLLYFFFLKWRSMSCQLYVKRLQIFKSTYDFFLIKIKKSKQYLFSNWVKYWFSTSKL